MAWRLGLSIFCFIAISPLLLFANVSGPEKPREETQTLQHPMTENTFSLSTPVSFFESSLQSHEAEILSLLAEGAFQSTRRKVEAFDQAFHRIRSLTPGQLLDLFLGISGAMPVDANRAGKNVFGPDVILGLRSALLHIFHIDVTPKDLADIRRMSAVVADLQRFNDFPLPDSPKVTDLALSLGALGQSLQELSQIHRQTKVHPEEFERMMGQLRIVAALSLTSTSSLLETRDRDWLLETVAALQALATELRNASHTDPEKTYAPGETAANPLEVIEAIEIDLTNVKNRIDREIRLLGENLGQLNSGAIQTEVCDRLLQSAYQTLSSTGVQAEIVGLANYLRRLTPELNGLTKESTSQESPKNRSLLQHSSKFDVTHQEKSVTLTLTIDHTALGIDPLLVLRLSKIKLATQIVNDIATLREKFAAGITSEAKYQIFEQFANHVWAYWNADINEMFAGVEARLRTANGSLPEISKRVRQLRISIESWQRENQPAFKKDFYAYLDHLIESNEWQSDVYGHTSLMARVVKRSRALIEAAPPLTSVDAALSIYMDQVLQTFIHEGSGLSSQTVQALRQSLIAMRQVIDKGHSSWLTSKQIEWLKLAGDHRIGSSLLRIYEEKSWLALPNVMAEVQASNIVGGLTSFDRVAKLAIIDQVQGELEKGIDSFRSLISQLSQSEELKSSISPIHEEFVRTVFSAYFRYLPLRKFVPVLQKVIGRTEVTGNDVVVDLLHASGVHFKKFLQAQSGDPRMGSALAKILKAFEASNQGPARKELEGIWLKAMPNFYPRAFLYISDIEIGVGSVAVTHQVKIRPEFASSSNKELLPEMAMRTILPTAAADANLDERIFLRIAARDIAANPRFQGTAFASLHSFLETSFRQVREELNAELTVARQLRGNLLYHRDVVVKEGRNRIQVHFRVPKIYFEHFATNGVMFMEMIQGGKPVDQFLRTRPTLGIAVTEAFSKLLAGEAYFGSGFFHADPHFGNSLARYPPGRGEFELEFYVIDFGLAGVFDRLVQEGVVQISLAIQSRDRSQLLKYTRSLFPTSSHAKTDHSVIIDAFLANALPDKGIDHLLTSFAINGYDIPEGLREASRLHHFMEERLLREMGSPMRVADALSKEAARRLLREVPERARNFFKNRNDMVPNLGVPLSNRDLARIFALQTNSLGHEKFLRARAFCSRVLQGQK